jgi:hypothetical protein
MAHVPFALATHLLPLPPVLAAGIGRQVNQAVVQGGHVAYRVRPGGFRRG